MAMAHRKRIVIHIMVVFYYSLALSLLDISLWTSMDNELGRNKYDETMQSFCFTGTSGGAFLVKSPYTRLAHTTVAVAVTVCQGWLQTLNHYQAGS